MYLQRLLLIDSSHLSLIGGLYPADVELARQAWQLYPDQPRTVFWLAGNLAVTDVTRAIMLYEHGLELIPLAAGRWMELGDLYRRDNQLEQALRAYAEALA